MKAQPRYGAIRKWLRRTLKKLCFCGDGNPSSPQAIMHKSPFDRKNAPPDSSNHPRGKGAPPGAGLDSSSLEIDVVTRNGAPNPHPNPTGPNAPLDLFSEPQSRKLTLSDGQKLEWEREVLGRGTFGTVHKGKLTDPSGEHVEVVIKFAQDLARDGDVKRILPVEIAVYQRVKPHPNTVKYLAGRGGGETPDGFAIRDFFVVLEYVPRNLQQVLDCDKSFDTYRKALKLMLGVATGLDYLHSLGIIHHDLKPQNILVTKDYIPKITDFGESKIRCGRSITATWRGTAQYIAPECKLGGWSKVYYPEWKKFKEDEKIDTFSFGVILWEIAAGGDEEQPGPNDKTVKYGASGPVKCNCPDILRDLIGRCLRFDLSQMDTKNYGRPSFEEIKDELAFMLEQNFDWLDDKLPPKAKKE